MTSLEVLQLFVVLSRFSVSASVSLIPVASLPSPWYWFHLSQKYLQWFHPLHKLWPPHTSSSLRQLAANICRYKVNRGWTYLFVLYPGYWPELQHLDYQNPLPSNRSSFHFFSWKLGRLFRDRDRTRPHPSTFQTQSKAFSTYAGALLRLLLSTALSSSLTPLDHLLVLARTYMWHHAA